LLFFISALPLQVGLRELHSELMAAITFNHKAA